MVKHEEQVSRNISLAFHVLREALQNPQVLERVPDGRALIPMPDQEPELKQANARLLKKLKQERIRKRARATRPSPDAVTYQLIDHESRKTLTV